MSQAPNVLSSDGTCGAFWLRRDIGLGVGRCLTTVATQGGLYATDSMLDRGAVIDRSLAHGTLVHALQYGSEGTLIDKNLPEAIESYGSEGTSRRAALLAVDMVSISSSAHRYEACLWFGRRRMRWASAVLHCLRAEYTFLCGRKYST